MKMTNISVILQRLLFGLALIIAGAVHAEGGCPPGMIPASGTNLNSCAPIPAGYYNNQQQTPQQSPPPPRWISKWGAIATDFAHDSAGASVDQPDRSSAELAAIANCQENGGSACKIETWYSDGCATMVVGDKTHVSLNAATISEATQAGMKMCARDGDTNCHVYYSACSLPVRIQ